jgi:cobalt-zinc-cadmium efflux system outer membrane protein
MRVRALQTLFLCLLAARSPAAGAQEILLDRDKVIELARAQAPAVKLAAARIGEARALRVGARAPATPNPEVGIAVGPRALLGTTVIDVVGSLSIPIDLSGALSLRVRVADERARAAEAEADDARRLAVGAALDAFLVALGTGQRVQLEQERAQLDDTLYASARVRRQAGTIGDLDLQLTAVLRADSLARLKRAEGERDAAFVSLRARLGLSPQAQIRLGGSLDAAPAPPLDALLPRLRQRPDRRRAQAAIDVADDDARLQRRLGVPAPRVTAAGGRDGELFARFGLDLPVPVYQRNQTARAVADARRATAAAEATLVDAAADADLRAAYATYVAAARAYEVLHAAAPATSDAEHLATRAYELGQTTLPNLVVARRETASARVAHLDARIALARARAALDKAAGALP